MSGGAKTIYVGIGYQEGKSVGFRAEVAEATVLGANTIQPGAASYHRADARAARHEGGLLKHKLTERSLKIKCKFSPNLSFYNLDYSDHKVRFDSL